MPLTHYILWIQICTTKQSRCQWIRLNTSLIILMFWALENMVIIIFLIANDDASLDLIALKNEFICHGCKLAWDFL